MGQVGCGLLEQAKEQLKDVEQQGEDVEHEREPIQELYGLGDEVNGTMNRRSDIFRPRAAHMRAYAKNKARVPSPPADRPSRSGGFLGLSVK
jgi:hypothetical protein